MKREVMILSPPVLSDLTAHRKSSSLITYPRTKSVAAPAAGSFHLNRNERSEPMYTRIVEITCKSGKARELCKTIEEKVVPILKMQTGFVDEAVLASDAEPDRVVGI